MFWTTAKDTYSILQLSKFEFLLTLLRSVSLLTVADHEHDIISDPTVAAHPARDCREANKTRDQIRL